MDTVWRSREPFALSKLGQRRALLIALIAYLAIVAALTVVPLHRVAFLPHPRDFDLNFVPFSSLRCAFVEAGPEAHRISFCLRNTLGNFALFLPLGTLLPLVSARFHSFKRFLFLIVCLSVAIETVQFLEHYLNNPRAADIDDVILNTLGACVGFAVYRLALGSVRGATADSR